MATDKQLNAVKAMQAARKAKSVAKVRAVLRRASTPVVPLSLTPPPSPMCISQEAKKKTLQTRCANMRTARMAKIAKEKK